MSDTTTPQFPNSIHAVNTDPDALWALPAVQQTLQLCGQLRRLAKSGEGPPIDLEFTIYGLKQSSDAAFALFSNGDDEPATMQELEPYLTQTLSAAAYALAVATALLDLAAEIRKGAADA